MKAIVCTKYGPPEVLELQEVAKPVPKHNQVLVKIHATTVTRGDVVLRGLKFPASIVFGLVFGLSRNKITGHELAGEIEAVGKDVTRFQVGDELFASTGIKGGANAEYICLPEDGMIAEKPANMTYDEAAAVPVGANTALHILRHGNIKEGQSVLIIGASGSVGTYAVQLARFFGAEVSAVCSAENFAMVKSLGAAHVIDYTSEDFTKNGLTYDVIFDTVNKSSSSHCKGSLKQGGVYLSARSSTKEKPENLVFLRELIESGDLKAFIDRRYPLAQIVEAHRYVEKGHKKGNVVITVPHSDPA